MPAEHQLLECWRAAGTSSFKGNAAIVAAHPDDEVIGAGAQLHRFERISIIHTTDGAPVNMADASACGFATREEYSRARRLELARALEMAGVPFDRTREIGLADQQASFHLADLARRLTDIFQDFAAEVVLTHPYEGGHPDHDATAFGVHAARELLRRAGRPLPEIMEFTSYNRLKGPMTVGAFLPNGPEPVRIALDGSARERKRDMMACFASQQWILKLFPVDFECFRTSPDYDFTQAPHQGPLNYEEFEWGMTGDCWRSLACAALRELGLDTPL
jgi:LmbE family N-acetylglucosaminyl deacetylase